MLTKISIISFILMCITSCSCNSNADKPLSTGNSTKQESKPSVNFIDLFKDTAFEDFHFYTKNNYNIFIDRKLQEYFVDSMSQFTSTRFYGEKPFYIYPKCQFKINEYSLGLIMLVSAGFNGEYGYAIGIYKNGKVTDLYRVAEEWGDAGLLDNMEGWLTENKTKLIVRKHLSNAHVMDGDALDSLEKGFSTHVDHYDSAWCYTFKNDSYKEVKNYKIDTSIYKFHNDVFMDAVMKPQKK